MKDMMIYKYASLIVIIFFIIMIGFMRYSNIQNQFGHGDDLVIPTLVLDSRDLDREGNVGAEHFMRRLALIVPTSYIDFAKKMATNIYPYLAVPLSQNYAAGQYLFYPLILTEDQSYEDKKLNSRIPSWVLSMLALLCLTINVNLLNYKNSVWFKVVPVILLGCSLEAYIYSRFALPYSAGVFAASILMLSLILYYQKKMNEVSFSLVWSLGLILNYQSWLAAPIVVAVIMLILNERGIPKIQSALNLIKISIVPALTFFPSYIIFLRNKHYSAVTYNSGTDREYLFNYKFDGVEDIYSTLAKLINNLVQDIGVMYLPQNLGYLSNQIVSIFLFISMIAGLLLMRRAGGVSKMLSWVAILFCLQIAILGLLNIFPMGPTRHFLFYSPFFALPISYLIFFVFENFLLLITNRQFAYIFSGILLIAYFLFAIQSFVGYDRAARDPINEIYMNKLVSENKPDAIIAGSCSFHARLLSYSVKKIPVFYHCGGQIRWNGHVNLALKPKRLLYISYAEPLQKKWFLFITESANYKIGESYFDTDMSKWSLGLIIEENRGYALEALDYTDHAYGRNQIYVSTLDLQK